MKKFIVILFACMLAVAGVKAQDKTVTFQENQTYSKISFAAADTISKYDNLYSVVFYPNQHYPLTQDVLVKITKVSGTPRIVVKLQAKKMEGTLSWTDIGTVTWYGGVVSGSDTTFTISNATANRYRIYRVYFNANTTAQKALLNNLEFKVFRE